MDNKNKILNNKKNRESPYFTSVYKQSAVLLTSNILLNALKKIFY